MYRMCIVYLYYVDMCGVYVWYYHNLWGYYQWSFVFTVLTLQLCQPRNLCKLSKYYLHKKLVQAVSMLPTQEPTYTCGCVFVIESHRQQFSFVCSCTHALTKPHKTRLNIFLHTAAITLSCELREEELEVRCLYIPLCCMQSKVNCNAIVLVTQFVVLQMQLPLKLSKRMRRLFPYLVSIHIHVLMYYMSGM